MNDVFEDIRDSLVELGLTESNSTFCRDYLNKSESYFRVLKFHNKEHTADTASYCAFALGKKAEQSGELAKKVLDSLVEECYTYIHERAERTFNEKNAT